MLYKKAKLYVPRGTMELYKQTSGWKNFVNIEEYDLPVDNPVGDVTGDGTIDISDVNAVINMMLGKAEQTAASDVTGDGSVDIADVNAVINIMLGKSQSF
ncbi:MAG: dockerin type I repeat-containing protein [Muribaculaceae bacterium]|nr:dockerin type I repeat-containing protein [Muribaculaceae bacterium]